MSGENAIQASQLLPVPRLTTLSDRCWCDLSGGHIFDPYNMTLWQLTSLSRTLGATKSRRILIVQNPQLPPKPIEPPAEPSENKRMTKIWVLRMTGKDGSRLDEGEGEEEEWSSRAPSPTSTLRIWGWPLSFFPTFQPFSFFLSNQPLADSPEDLSTVTQVMAAGTAMEKDQFPLIRRTYDLRRHGINLVVDLGWGRSYI